MPNDDTYRRSDAAVGHPAAEYSAAVSRQTVGDVRAAVRRMGARGWSVAPHLADDAPLPHYALGGELRDQPRSADVPRLDVAHLLTRAIANPLLRARNQQLQTRDLQIVVTSIGLDWRTRWGGRWLATMQDQNPCNNCWAFAATALVETMVRIEHGVWAKRSEGDLRDGWGGPTGENWVVRDGPKATPCVHGAGVTDALDWIAANGLADPDCYSWSAADKSYAPTADRAGRTVRVGKYEALGDDDDVRQWLDAVGPVVCCFDVYSDFMVYAGPEVYHRTPTATKVGSHCLLIVGYDALQQTWIIRNSWGTTWGMDGYGLLGYGECDIDGPAKVGLRNTNPDPWTKRRLHAGNFFESGNGAEHRNFEMVRGDAPRVRHLWRDGGSGGFVWHEAATLESPDDDGAGRGCVGQPAATSTTFNRNFEAVYWELTGRLRHWWMDQRDHSWHDGGVFGPDDVEGFPAFIQGNFGAPGNLEVVVRRRGGQLAHWWRDSIVPFAWHDGGVITTRVQMSGPSLVQANVGTKGHFYVVCVTDRGTMQLWWRDNDHGLVWKPGEVFGRRVGSTPVCMIQGQFGATDELTPGNFELCVAVDGRAEHWFRDNSAIGVEAPRADHADPRFSDVVHTTVSSAHVEPAGGTAVRADVAVMLHDASNTQVSDVVKAGLGNATISGLAPDRWHRLAVFGHDVKHVWGLVEGSFGFNLEVVVERTDGALQHYFRDGNGWNEGALIDA